MKIEIGLRSNGNPFVVRLEAHLFVSYTEQYHISSLFTDIIRSADHTVRLFLSVSELLKMRLPEPGKNVIMETEAVLIEMVHQELISRLAWEIKPAFFSTQLSKKPKQPMKT